MANAEIRVSFEENEGNWCIIGNSCEDVPRGSFTMNFNPSSLGQGELEFRRVVLHSFGHVLGLIDEHQRPGANIKWDEEAVYLYYCAEPFSMTQEQVKEWVFPSGYDNLRPIPFDDDSIMLLSFPSRLTMDKVPLKGGYKFSHQDIVVIKQCYPYPFAITSDLLSLDMPPNQRRVIEQVVTITSPRLDQTKQAYHGTVLLGINMLYVEAGLMSAESAIPESQDDTLIEVKVNALHSCGWSWLAFSMLDRDHGIQHGRTTLNTRHQSIPRRFRGREYLPRNFNVPIIFPHPYPDSQIPIVAAWIHSVRCTPITGRDFGVVASNVHHRGFDLECNVSQEFECEVTEIGVSWLAYSPRRDELYTCPIDILQSDSDDTTWSHTLKVDKWSDSENKPQIFAAFSRLSVAESSVQVSLEDMRYADGGFTLTLATQEWKNFTYAQVIFIAGVSSSSTNF